MRPPIIEKLTAIFLNLPGIGPKQASRFAYWMADADKSLLENFKSALDEVKAVRRCPSCFKVESKDSNCSICSDPSRTPSKIAVVEKDTDLEAMEKSGSYDGHYHVLGGLISVIDSESKDRLRARELFNRINKNKGVSEIILALSATPEGEFSARYLEKILEPLSEERKIKISRLGRGLSSGAELEYLNRETIKNALENRK